MIITIVDQSIRNQAIDKDLLTTHDGTDQKEIWNRWKRTIHLPPATFNTQPLPVVTFKAQHVPEKTELSTIVSQFIADVVDNGNSSTRVGNVSNCAVTVVASGTSNATAKIKFFIVV